MDVARRLFGPHNTLPCVLIKKKERESYNYIQKIDIFFGDIQKAIYIQKMSSKSAILILLSIQIQIHAWQFQVLHFKCCAYVWSIVVCNCKWVCMLAYFTLIFFAISLYTSILNLCLSYLHGVFTRVYKRNNFIAFMWILEELETFHCKSQWFQLTTVYLWPVWQKGTCLAFPIVHLCCVPIKSQ